MKTIGILGGMGPRATVKFEQLLLDMLKGSDQEIPKIVSINDGSIPDRSSFLQGQGQDPVPAIQNNLKKLELIGAEIIAIPCNSASMPAIFNRLDSTMTLLDLPLIVAQDISKKGLNKICVLATPGTVQSGKYQELLNELGVETINPSSSLQKIISMVIANVKSGKIEEAKNLAKQVRSRIESQGVNGILLGCTELPLIKSSLVPKGVLAIDTLEVLAETCVKYSQGDK
jgi:aspartate racemase